MGKSGRKWYRESLFRAAVTREEEPVEFRTDTPKISPNETKTTEIATVFTSLVTAVAVAAMKCVAPITGKTMFRGNHPARVDEKGRLKVPAEFKRVIDEKYGNQFYITSLDGKVAQVYPFEEWERIEQKLASLSTFNPTKKKFLDRVNYYGQMVEMDGQGRLLIPQLLRDNAQIKGEVAVLGNLTYLIVRNLEVFRKEIEEQAFTAEDEKTLDDLGI